MKRALIIAGLVLFLGANAGTGTAANDMAEEARIKAVVKQAFITEEKSYVETIEDDNDTIHGNKLPKAMFGGVCQQQKGVSRCSERLYAC